MLSSLLATFGANDRGIILFGFEIYYYAICIVCGMIIAATLSALLMKRRNMAPDFIFTLFIVCIPLAIVCARLFYILTDDTMKMSQFFEFRNGGLSIIGGVIGGVSGGLITCLIKKVNFFRAADCVVVTILLAQALGRWGNFFNKEVYGGVVTNPNLQWFPFAVPVSPSIGVNGIGSFADAAATWHYAFFFYEMVLNLIGFALLYTMAWYRKSKPNGILMFLYFVWYGMVRACMEPLRDPSFILSNGGVPWSEVFSIAMIGFGIIGCLVLMLLNFLKEGKFVGSKRGDPCGITEYLTPYKDEKPYYSKINMFGEKYPPKPSKEELKAEKKARKEARKAGNSAEQEKEELLATPYEEPQGSKEEQGGDGENQ